MDKIEKFRPGSAVATGWVLIIFFAGFIFQTIFYGGDILTTLLLCSGAIVGSFLLFLKPYVLIFDEGIKIVNPTKEITSTWGLVDQIETKFTMSIFVNGQTFYAWAAPAPGRSHTRRMHKTDRLPGSDIPRRIADSPGSDSGACSHIAKLRLRQFTPTGDDEFEIISNFKLLYIGVGLFVTGLATLIF